MRGSPVATQRSERSVISVTQGQTNEFTVLIIENIICVVQSFKKSYVMSFTGVSGGNFKSWMSWLEAMADET